MATKAELEANITRLMDLLEKGEALATSIIRSEEHAAQPNLSRLSHYEGQAGAIKDVRSAVRNLFDLD